MSWLSRLANVFRDDSLSRDLDDELRFHVEARTEDLVRRGLTRRDAEREARRRLGNPLLLREMSRDVKLLPRLESILRDVRFGLRMLGKHRVVTGAAVASLSLAIGAGTAAFSLIDALVLRPLPVREPERLVYLSVTPPGVEAQERDSFNYPLFERFRDGARPRADLFGASYQGILRPVVFDDPGGEEEKIRLQWISGDAFAVLGVKPALGRLLSAADDQRPGAHPVAVLSHGFWTRRFGQSPSVLGRWLTLKEKEKQLQIVGVAQEGFSGVEPGVRTDLWAPNMMYDQAALTRPDWHWFRIWGRIRPDVTPEQLRGALQPTFAAFLRERADTFRPDEPRDRLDRHLRTPLNVRSAANGPSVLRRDFERPLWILALVAGLVLLIACSNVANLLIARAAARGSEMALRVSIGAGRGRLIQQVLVESALLAGAACVAGLALASVMAPAIVQRLSPADNPAYLDLRLDGRALAFLSVVCAATTFLFGLAPALRASAVSPSDALKAEGGKRLTGLGPLRPLVAAQMGVSFVVLFVAGLLLLSFQRLTSIDPGFAKTGVVLLTIEAKSLKEGERARAAGLQLQDRVRGLSGVRSVSLSAWGLFSGSGWTTSIRVAGREPDSFEPYFLEVSPGFFETMRIPMRGGRELAAPDTQPEHPTAVVVNEAFARRYFPGEDPLGKRFERVERSDTVPQEIVGLAGDAKYNDLREVTPPTVYVPLGGVHMATLQVRTTTDPMALASMLRTEIPRIHPALRVTDVTLQSTLIDNTLIRERLLALLSGFFALVAVALVAVGLYGVLSYSVVRRTREIGIRVALGARRLRIVRLVVRDVTLPSVLGVATGLLGGTFLARLLAALLFEVEPFGLGSLGLPLGCLLLVSALAALPPVLRATRVDPAVALRYE